MRNNRRAFHFAHIPDVFSTMKTKRDRAKNSNGCFNGEISFVSYVMKLELISESSCRKLSLTLLLIIFNNTPRYVNDLKNNNDKITDFYR